MQIKFSMARISLRVKYGQILMCLLFITVAYIQRVNLSVAIVAMTHQEENTSSPTFAWNASEKSEILSSFFWGYIWLQIHAGNMAQKFGAKMFMAYTMLISSLVTLLIPWLAGYGYQVIMLLRILQGLVQGACYPSVTVLLTKWISLSERSRALAIAYSGRFFGTFFGLLVSGYLASTAGGWPSIFYVTGGLGCAWVILWYFVGASTPEDHSKAWKNGDYSVQTASLEGGDRHLPKIPWKRVLTSVPVLALTITHFGSEWGYWTLLTELPTYIASIFQVDIARNGFLSSLPYLVGGIAVVVFSKTDSFICEKYRVNKTIKRKIWTAIGMWGNAAILFYLGLSTVANETTTTMLILILIMITYAGVYPGFYSCHADLSHNFCGTLMGITNAVGNISASLGPLSVGWIVTDETSPEQWKLVFLLSGVIMFFTNLVYTVFGSSEAQPWNEAL